MAATHPDVEYLVQTFQNSGKQAAAELFDQIAKQRKLKSFEAHTLAIGFQRECKARGISLEVN